MSSPIATGPATRAVAGIAALVAAICWATKMLTTVTSKEAPIEVGSLITLRLSRNAG